MAQDELTGVVAGGADGSLGLHGAELAGVVAVAGAAATRIAQYVHAIDAIGGIELVAGEVIEDILRGSISGLAYIRWARNQGHRRACSGCVRKQVFPIGNLLNSSRADSAGVTAVGNDLLVEFVLQLVDRLKVVHPRGWVNEVEGHPEVDVLQCAASEAPHVVGLDSPAARNLALNGDIDLCGVRRLQTIVDDVGEGLGS